LPDGKVASAPYLRYTEPKKAACEEKQRWCAKWPLDAQIGWSMQLTDLKIGQLIRVTTGTDMYYEPPTFYECYNVVAYPVIFAAESGT
jgi:hypothetical protein